jgi:hypothetical protein
MMGLAGKLISSGTSKISYVSAASAAGANTLALPTYQPDDLLVLFAYNSNQNATPTLPSGWTNSGSIGNIQRLAYRVATGTDPVGNWTNATDIAVHVYRGALAITTPATASSSTTLDSTLTYGGSPSLKKPNAWTVAFAGSSGNTGVNINTPPTGMVNRTSAVGGSNSIAGHDSNGTQRTSTSVVSLNQSVTYGIFVFALQSA